MPEPATRSRGDATVPGPDPADQHLAVAAARPAPVPLTHPADGVPPVLTRPDEMADLAAALASGTGPVAIDAERASGYRYGQRAYLVQLRRAGVGTVLVDPVALADLTSLGEALAGVEWVLHAAHQDLPCLAELGLHPSALFDTELAGRLLGRDRVGLAAIVAQELGLHLAKEHSAVDWSSRPLPEPWLRYAALDVEVLVELRHSLAKHLTAAGKADWAAQEFEAVRLAPPPAPRSEPWRRVSGVHRLRDRRRLAVVREMWAARDELARERDVFPGRVIPDSALVAAAEAFPESAAELARVPGFTGRSTRRQVSRWQEAVDRARALHDPDLPARRAAGGDAVPPTRAWASRRPEAAVRLDRVRATVRALAGTHSLPQENLLAPDTQRRLAWDPPGTDAASVAAFLAAAGARPWQVHLSADELSRALSDAAGPGTAA